MPASRRAFTISGHISSWRLRYSSAWPGFRTIRKAMRSAISECPLASSDNAPTTGRDCRPLSRNLLPVTGRSVGRNRIDRTSRIEAGHGQYRFDVGAVGCLQRLGRHERVIVLLIGLQCLAIDKKRLGIGTLHLDCRQHQTFDRVGYIVRSEEHTSELQSRENLV